MIILPNTDASTALADWIEASLLKHSGRHYRISDTTILDVLQEAESDEPDALLANIISTVASRNRMAGDAYPIERDGLGFVRKGEWSRYLPYSFMLMTSLNQIYVELRFTRGTAARPAEYFENLTSIAIQQYLKCSVVRIGAPRRSPVPATFPRALEYALEQLNEPLGERDLVKHNSGDDGVDLIGWQSFEDGRESQAILLAQCAIGNDWRDKLDAINLEMWRRHIDWHATPLRGFAVPFQVEHGALWREASARAGIVFDRLRIAKATHGTDLPRPVRQNMTTWCRTRIERLAPLTVDGR